VTMLLFVACVDAGGIVFTVASSTMLVRDLRRWWFLVLAVAVVTALFTLSIHTRLRLRSPLRPPTPAIGATLQQALWLCTRRVPFVKADTRGR
jgi:hypothetical protein